MMDLPCSQWQDHVAQKWTILDTELKEYFTSLLGIDDVFKCALTQTTQEDLDFLQGISKGHPVQKDTEQAARCRERGNSSFKTRDYTAAALHYSQGVCFAPQSSEQLPLCYANRSAALYHLQLYQESLDDIGRALKYGYPSHLLYKLHDRRTQCLNHLSVGQRGKLDHHQPDSKDHKGPERVERPNVKPPKTYIHNGTDRRCCVSPQVAVCFSPEKGRHLVVTERIAAGELILKDRPYSCVLIPGIEEVKGREKREKTEKGVLFGTEDRHCHRCLSETMCPVPCKGCSYSRYCSSGCRQEAWEEHHRWECPLGADLMMMGVMSQLALRVTLKAGLKNVQIARETIRDKDSDPRPITESRPSCLNDDSVCSTFHTNKAEPFALYYGDSYLSIYHLLHHLNRHSPSLRFLCAITVATLYLKLSRAGPLPVSWDLSGASGTNSQSHSPDDEEETAGWSRGLWLLGSAVLRHMLQLRCNAQAVTVLQDTGASDSVVQSNQEIRIATAIFPTLSLLNHSCCPNTSLVFSAGANADLSGPDMSADFGEDVAEFNSAACGVSVTARAAKAITPGQEILHCYGPHSSRMVTRKRQHLLQEQYYFLCKCEACNLQQEEEGTEGSWQGPGIGGRPNDSGLQCGKCKWPLKKCHRKDTETGFICSQSSCGQHMSYSEVRRRLQEVRDHLDKALDLMERDRPDEALRLLERTMSQSGLILTETHRLQGELADAMARAYATMGDWNSAASQLERSVVAISSQYGEDSIELGRQLFKLAQLHFNGGATRPALSVIPRIRRLLGLHCGPHCPELHELQAMEDCLRG